MEMVENKLEKSLKLNEEEIMEEKKEEDRISVLPDSLLIEFLARLPSTKDAIRTGKLSKRWDLVWTSVPNLIFIHDDDDTEHSLSDFFSSVILTLSQICPLLKLNKFHLQTPYESRFELELKTCVRYATHHNVKVFTLILLSLEYGSEFVLEQLFFTTSSFTHLRLARCVLRTFFEINWKNLQTLFISSAKLDEDLIQKILSGSPLLDTLNFECCYGYKRIDITSKSVKKFVFSGHKSPEPMSLGNEDMIEINAPNILSLTIQDDLRLRNLLLLDVSSVVKSDLDYRMDELCETTPEEDEEMLKGFILSLRHAKELKIGMSCCRVLSRLEAKALFFH